MKPIGYAPLGATTKRDGFTCGVSEIDKWFRNNALADQGKGKHVVTCAFFEDEPEAVIGFYALSTVVEDARKFEKSAVPFFDFRGTQHCPCLQIVYMAVRQDLQEQDHGRLILGDIVSYFATIGQEIGLPALILTPLNDRAARFYKRDGFVPYVEKHRPGMFLPLKTAVAALAAALEEEPVLLAP